MTVQQRKLRWTDKGFIRDLGWTATGNQPRFLLGRDERMAEARLELIEALWHEQLSEHVQQTALGRTTPTRPVWSDERLTQGKAIAAGKGSPALKPLPFENGAEFVRRVSSVPGAGAINQQQFEEIKALLIDKKDRANRDANPLVGKTLFEAVRQYFKHVEKAPELIDEDGTVSVHGANVIKQLRNAMTYLKDVDLGQLDYDHCDDIYATFRRRPKGKRYGKPLSHKYCKDVIHELNHFFKWLHKCSLPWRRPEDFADINRKVRRFNEAEAEAMAKPVAKFTTKELETLVSYATPYEKLVLLLGLNCGFGADMIGRIRPKHLRRTKKGNFVLKLVRPKRKTSSIHKLWPELVDGLNWQIERRPDGCEDFVFVAMTGKRKGQQLYRKTKSGNSSRKIAEIWNTLVDRVVAANPEFRKGKPKSLKLLRKTSSNEVNQLGGSELATLHTAHGTAYKHDPSLHHYVDPRQKQHFKVLDQMRDRWLKVVTGGPDWESKAHLSRKPK